MNTVAEIAAIVIQFVLLLFVVGVALAWIGVIVGGAWIGWKFVLRWWNK